MLGWVHGSESLWGLPEETSSFGSICLCFGVHVYATILFRI